MQTRALNQKYAAALDRIPTRALVYFIWLMMVLTYVMRVISFADRITLDQSAKDYEAKTTLLKEQDAILENEYYNITSLEYVKNRAREMGFTKPAGSSSMYIHGIH